MKNPTQYRIESIDLLRGVVMVIMALDHVRDYFNFGSFFRDPTDLAHTTPFLFFTRWITHFCAPVFVFLAGTSAFLYGTRGRSTKHVSRFLLTRGLWLIVLELTIVSFAWSFDPRFSLIVLQVIWAIGISMIILSVLVYLPLWLIILTGVLMVAGHNLLDFISLAGTTPGAVLWYILHQRALLSLGPRLAIDIVYPALPWIGLMALGYAFGQLYQKGFDTRKRRRWLLRLGIGSITLFILLRFFNIYGDPNPRQSQSTFTYSLLSFLKTTKYPPSLLFLLMTMGPSLLFLCMVEGLKNWVTQVFVIIGRVPLFYYIIHIYLIHLFAVIGLIFTGQPWTDMILTAESYTSGYLLNYGYNLAVVYPVWIVTLILLYPLCKWYNKYKTSHRSKWWLSYL
jgi:uncharacterized membrane protein